MSSRLPSAVSVLMLLPALLLARPLIAETSSSPESSRNQDVVTRAAEMLAGAMLDHEDILASWAWRRGDQRAAPNTAGLVALALMEAYQATGCDEAFDAARKWAKARLADIDAWRPLFDPDVEALAKAALLTGDVEYFLGAREAFLRRWEGASGEEIVSRLSMVRRHRSELIGYDAALVIRAALSVGEESLATDIALAALSKRDASGPFEEAHGVDVSGLSTTSMAALLGAIGSLPRKRYAAERDAIGPRLVEELMLALVASQDACGSWALRNTQTTAYAVHALANMRCPIAREAARRGAEWLTSTQLSDGTWASFNDGLPEPFVGEVIHEVTAEVLLAISAMSASDKSFRLQHSSSDSEAHLSKGMPRLKTAHSLALEAEAPNETPATRTRAVCGEHRSER